jgi:recombinational DNA repair ATPase RecF
MDSLLSLRIAEQRLAEIHRRISERLFEIPLKLADEIAAESDPARVRALLECEITRARRELADALEGVSIARSN